MTPGGIGLVFLVLGLANTAARIPAGWLVDRTQHSSVYAILGVLVGAITTALLPHVTSHISLLALVALFGAVNGIAGVAIGVALTRATTPAVRGLSWEATAPPCTLAWRLARSRLGRSSLGTAMEPASRLQGLPARSGRFSPRFCR
jgi:MFS family permease